MTHRMRSVFLLAPNHRARHFEGAVDGPRAGYALDRTGTSPTNSGVVWSCARRPFLALSVTLVLGAGCSKESAPARDSVDLIDLIEETSIEESDLVEGDSEVEVPTDVALDTASEIISDVDDVRGDAVSDAGVDTADEGPDSAGPTGCVAHPFEFIDLPEASGAANLGAGRYLVVADSGHSGQALVVDHQTGAATPVTLPLGSGAGDDIEGLEAAPDGRIFGLTSAGFLRAWRVEVTTDGPSAELVFGPVAVSAAAEWACDPLGVNCGPNYEGLCLHPAPSEGDCAGWAASKALGELVCLRSSGDGFVIDPSVRRVVLPADQLSGCAFAPDAPHRLFVAGNVYSGDQLYEVLADRMEPRVTGAANQEAVLVLPRAASTDSGPPLAPPLVGLLSFGDWQTLGDGRSPRVTIECP